MILLSVCATWFSYWSLKAILAWTVECVLPSSVEVHQIEGACVGYDCFLQKRPLLSIAGFSRPIPLSLDRIPKRGDYGIFRVYRIGPWFVMARVLKVAHLRDIAEPVQKQQRSANGGD